MSSSRLLSPARDSINLSQESSNTFLARAANAVKTKTSSLLRRVPRLFSRSEPDTTTQPSGARTMVGTTGLYLLAGAKIFISAAGSLFNSEKVIEYAERAPGTFSRRNLAISSVSASITLLYTIMTRGKQMLEPPAAKVALPTSGEPGHRPTYEELDTRKKIVYFAVIGLSKGSQFFTALAAYNSAVAFWKTLEALISSCSDKEASANISANPAKLYTMQLSALICFIAQIVSFNVFQSQKVKKYLLEWWFDAEKRAADFQSHRSYTPLLALYFLITISSTTFFGIFSTESGLENLNTTFSKPILGVDIPQDLLDLGVSISALCLACITCINQIPSTYDYLNRKSQKTSLTFMGKVARGLGALDCLTSAAATVYSCIRRLGSILDVDYYNPSLVAATVILTGPPNIFYNFNFNTLIPTTELYPLKTASNDMTTTLLNSASEEYHPLPSYAATHLNQSGKKVSPTSSTEEEKEEKSVSSTDLFIAKKDANLKASSFDHKDNSQSFGSPFDENSSPDSEEDLLAEVILTPETVSPINPSSHKKSKDKWNNGDASISIVHPASNIKKHSTNDSFYTPDLQVKLFFSKQTVPVGEDDLSQYQEDLFASGQSLLGEPLVAKNALLDTSPFFDPDNFLEMSDSLSPSVSPVKGRALA